MIDLHMHTTYSDGTDSVQLLLEKAEKSKLEIISITDHDSVDAYFELEKKPKIRNLFSGEIIIGSEIKSFFDNVNIEILAYGIDYHNINIKKEDRQKVQSDILKHFISVGKSLGLKIDDDIRIDITNPGKQFAPVVFCDSILKYKENEKILPVNKFTFYREHEGNKASPFYYDTSKYFDDCKTLINKIHNAGGLAFLAHGLLYPFDDKKATIEKMLKTTNIDGLECIYPLFSEEEKEFMKNLCKKYNKYISGGSDYHAKTKPNVFMGTGINNNILVGKDIVKEWIDKVRKI